MKNLLLLLILISIANNIYCHTKLAPPSISKNVISKDIKNKIRNKKKKRNEHLYNFPGLRLYLKIWKKTAVLIPGKKKQYSFMTIPTKILLSDLKFEVAYRFSAFAVLTLISFILIILAILEYYPSGYEKGLGSFIAGILAGFYPGIWLRNVKNIIEQRNNLHLEINSKCVTTSM